ncbi:hypothetical protein [Liquorilactobacillus uvarum]|uniref:hypothetical protein n=1 Tax=Liquorilactobacillus uvarum TaxID=303240 RepID=UPI00288C396F|nr:hypothetical protein [Liquorilactobacillus uvarum]
MEIEDIQKIEIIAYELDDVRSVNAGRSRIAKNFISWDQLRLEMRTVWHDFINQNIVMRELSIII